MDKEKVTIHKRKKENKTTFESLNAPACIVFYYRLNKTLETNKDSKDGIENRCREKVISVMKGINMTSKVLCLLSHYILKKYQGRGFAPVFMNIFL